MASTVESIEADIAAIKKANPNWLTDPGIRALITALINEKIQLQVVAPSPVAEKCIFVVSPPVEKNDVPTISKIRVQSQEDLDKFCSINHGWLVDSKSERAMFSNLIEDGTYTFAGSFYKATENDVRRRQVDDKILEFESALAVKSSVGPNCHIHPNVTFFDDKNKKKLMEIDAVVHVGGEDVPESVAYIIEASYSPQLSEVESLANKVRKFKELAPKHPHFKSVNSVVPVLAGRHWPKTTMDAAVAAKQWRVFPSGAGYQIVRGVHMLAKILKK